MPHSGILLFLLSLAATAAVQAALAPNHNSDRKLEEMYYAQQAREQAPDVVTLHIDGVAMFSGPGDGCPQVDNYTVDATVDGVVRGKLRKGDVIRISYRTKYYQCPGPQTRNPAILEAGEHHSAYLECDGKQCQLGGGAWSFLSAEDFATEYEAARLEQEYYEELYSDIRRTFYTEPNGKGEATELHRRDGTWMTTACWKSDDCIARQAHEVDLVTINTTLPDSNGGLVGDSFTFNCELMQANSVTLYRPRRDPLEFCRFADGSLTNLRMLKFHFTEYRVERLYEKIAVPKCLRIEPASPPQEGMAGYHGPLNNTLTLSCLSYLGSEKVGDEIIFKVRDERGDIHHLNDGDYIGERDGIVRDTWGEESLHIYQFLYIDDKREIVHVDLPRAP